MERITRVAAYALCVRADKRLLLARIAPGYPEPGHWTLPGGGVEFGEDPADACLRELEEETGLTGRITRLAGVNSEHSVSERPTGAVEFHALRILYRVEVTGGAMRDELDGSTDTCAWLTREQIAAMPIVTLVARGLRMLDGPESTE